MDVVFTWVDDQFAGYKAQLGTFATDLRDQNPNRTRDNLDILKYALRSLVQNLPNLGTIHLLTARPQVPAWLNLDVPGLKLVHHDQVIAAEHLPTFSSFSIVSHLHLIPGLSNRFYYFEDDMLLMARDLPHIMQSANGPPYVFMRQMQTRTLAQLDAQTDSPWNLAMATATAALNQRFALRPRHHVAHGPQLIDRQVFQAMIEAFPELIETTRQSRFRAAGTVPPEYLYPHFALETGAAIAASRSQARHFEGYASLENFRPWTWAQLAWLKQRRPATITLNDSFSDHPNPGTEAMVARWLQRQFPLPSPFEIP